MEKPSSSFRKKKSKKSPRKISEKLIFQSSSPEMTIRIGKDLAKKLRPGAVIALSGDLGSGKTTFIKGIALGLGLKNSDEVKSPTFALMHIYPARIPLYHFDLYRLESLKEIQNIGLEHFIADPSAMTCIEWAEKADALLPALAIKIVFEAADQNTRRISIAIP